MKKEESKISKAKTLGDEEQSSWKAAQFILDEKEGKADERGEKNP